jgi:hypothetical protein
MTTGQQQVPQEKKKGKSTKVQHCKDAEKAIVFYRGKVWEYQDGLGENRDKTFYPERRRNACSYKKYAASKWQSNAAHYRKLMDRLDTDRAYTVCYVFGPHCREAIAVSKCESGDSMSIHASNGQYQGMFQMGSSERRIFGHGPRAIQQVRAAYRYFVASGRDWSPWACKP